jgi:hypothetical protein
LPAVFILKALFFAIIGSMLLKNNRVSQLADNAAILEPFNELVHAVGYHVGAVLVFGTKNIQVENDAFIFLI